jgi:hypothetical protein
MIEMEKFSPDETKRRMEAAVRGARIAGHKTMTDIPKKNGESRSKKPGRTRRKSAK